MTKLAIGASALSLLVIGPAWATAPSCQAQLSSIKGYMSEYPATVRRIVSTYNEAARMCKYGWRMEAEDLARSMRDTLAQSFSQSPTNMHASVRG